MIDEILEDAEERMVKSVESLKISLLKVRTGRAHPSLLSHLNVEYYGALTPLNQVANVSVEDARTLSITLWEKDMVKAVEKAILQSDLGFNPMTAGTVIRIPIPPLTEERRRGLVKVVRQEGEKAKVAIRNIRREANSDFKELEKEGEISEDESHRGQDQIQKLTDAQVKGVDAVLNDKEVDLMQV